MKRVSFKTAKRLKEAGYPQKGLWYYSPDGRIGEVIPDDVDFAAPTYLDVWLWLWREKHCYIQTDLCFRQNNESAFICIDKINNVALVSSNSQDPEEAIIAAIEYLVDNDLIK